MPGITGQELLSKINQQYPDVPVIVITGVNDLPTAVECMKLGALDYMVKPVEKSRLISGVARAIDLRNLRLENIKLREQLFTHKLEHPEAFAEIVTANSKMQRVFEYAETVAPSIQPVLITGETGVGKELLARAIHKISGRKGDFVAVNVAGLDDTMFSDTLFGHLTGAYTGAEKGRSGLIEKAAHGTLFLDEIGDLSHASQVKLLRLLQEKEYMPLGSDIPKRSDARIIASTHRDLLQLQNEGKFRKDLYYRLHFHPIHIPPLRERLDDLPILIQHFIKKAAKTLGKTEPTVPKELYTLLGTYDFPGNVRELEAMIFDALSQHKSHMLSLAPFREHLEKHRQNRKQQLLGKQQDPLANPFSSMPILPDLDAAKKLLIEEAMRRSNNNQSVASKLLGITQQGLNKWLRTHSVSFNGTPTT